MDGPPRRKGRGIKPAAFSKSNRRHSDTNKYSSSRIDRKFPMAAALVRAEMKVWPVGSKVHDWLASFLEG